MPCHAALHLITARKQTLMCTRGLPRNMQHDACQLLRRDMQCDICQRDACPLNSQVEFERHLSAAEAALDRHSSGPFFLGEFSHVDLMFMPALERFAANIPFVRGMKIRGNPDYPLLDDWFEAMDAKPSYQAVNVAQDGIESLLPGCGSDSLSS